MGTLLGVGVLPCPECGAPMIFHFWPTAVLLTVVQVLKGRYRARPARRKLPVRSDMLIEEYDEPE